MKTIAILNLKGGVGKTTTAIHVAEHLADQNKRTLLVDLDGQCNLTQFYNIEVSKADNVFRLFDDKEPIEPTFIRRKLYILPSNTKTSKVDINIAAEPGMMYILQKMLNSEKYKSTFDYVVIDCPPSIGLIVLNALTAATHIIIPLPGGEYAYKGLNASLSVARSVKESFNPGLNILGILPTMFSPRTRASQQLLERLRTDDLNGYLLKSRICLSEAFRRAELDHTTIWKFDQRCVAAIAMSDACKEIYSRIRNK